MVFSLGKLAENFLLLCGEFLWNLNLDNRYKIAMPTRTEVGKSLAIELIDITVLGTCVDAELATAINRGNIDLSTESGLRKTDRKFDDKVVTVTLEEWVVFDTDDDMEIATEALPLGRSLGRRGFALTLHTHSLPFVNPGRNLHSQLAFLGHSTLAAAGIAVFFYYFASPATTGAGGDHAEHATEALLSDLALAAAGCAGFGLGAGLCAGAGAFIADIEACELDLAFASLGDIGEINGCFVFEVVASGGAGSSSATATASPTTAEDLFEHGEDVVGVHA